MMESMCRFKDLPGFEWEGVGFHPLPSQAIEAYLKRHFDRLDTATQELILGNGITVLVDDTDGRVFEGTCSARRLVKFYGSVNFSNRVT